MTGKEPKVSNPVQITIGNEGMLGVGEIAFSREEHTNWLTNTQWLSQKTCL